MNPNYRLPKYIFLLVLVCLVPGLTILPQQPVTITIAIPDEPSNISPFIFGNNNCLSDDKNHPLSQSQWQHLRDLGIRIFRENGGNNSTKYNWRRKLSSHPDWYNNVYPHDWDYAAQSLQANIPSAQGIWAFQLVGKAAKSGSFNFNDWGYNRSIWWDGVAQNLCGGGDVNPSGGADALSEGDPSLYLEDWTADSTAGILDHWFGGNGIALDADGIRYWNMDNEPEIWSGTHDDVWPEQPDTETFMQSYFAVARKARALYPHIRLMGPSPANEWQWYNWNGSKISYEGKTYVWLEYFIRRVAEEQQASDTRLLDVLDIHFYPGELDPSEILQVHRVFFDSTYNYPGANGVKRSGSGVWDNAITKEYIFSRCNYWLDKYLGANHGVKLAVSEMDIRNDDPNVSACWYASQLGEFARYGVEIFTPWSWNTGMNEVVHLFSRYGRELYASGSSSNEEFVSAYPTVNQGKDSMTVFLVNRHLTETQTASLNLSGFTLDDGTYPMYVLSGLPENETFVSHTVNALESKSASVTDQQIHVELEPMSVAAVILTKTGNPFGGLVTAVEAEQGTLSGVYLSTAVQGYSGTGYVTGFDNASDKVTVTVNIPASDLYKVMVRYLGVSGEKYQNLAINGGYSTPVHFPASDTFSYADAGNYLLEQGSNTLALSKNWGWTDIDRFEIYHTEKNTYNITSNLVDTAATEATKAVYAFLMEKFGNRIISGQTHDYYSQVRNIAGKSPVIRGGDMQRYTDGYPYLWANGGHTFGKDDDGTVDNLKNWYTSTGKKGIITFQWHWHSPTGGSAGTNTFYTDYTTFDITRAVTPGTQEYDDIIRDIDDIAVQLKKFRDAGIPILWRPLHEAGGGWFWWGAKGPEACKALYNIMFDRLKNYHQLHNLIWVWSTPETEWYPGNDKVDIIGYDSYPGIYNYGNQKYYFDILYRLTNGEKLIAMTENGPIPNPDDCLNLDAPWSYFMSWSDLVSQQNTSSHIREVFENPRVMTLESFIEDASYLVAFRIFNEYTMNPVFGANIMLDTVTQVTNTAGETLFRQNGGSIPYAVSISGYQDISGSLDIQSDTTILLYLTQTHADVKFRLKSGTTPVNLALVVVNSDSLTTNSLGIALFRHLPVSENYNYKISKQGFVTEEGSFVLATDTTLDFSMQIQTGLPNLNDETGKLFVWPNPAQDRLNIYLSGGPAGGTVQITDLRGAVMYHGDSKDDLLRLDIREYSPGVYIIQVLSGEAQITQYFIKI